MRSLHIARRQRRWALVFPVLLLALGAAALAACGDDDSSAATAASSAPATQSTASTETGGANSAASPQDTAYAKQVCSAFNNVFADTIDAITKDPNAINDPQKLTDAIKPSLQKFVDDISKVKPPAGLQDFQDQVVAKLHGLIDKVNKGQLTSIADLGQLADAVRPAQAVQDRLTAAAAAVPECQSGPLGNVFDSQTPTGR